MAHDSVDTSAQTLAQRLAAPGEQMLLSLLMRPSTQGYVIDPHNREHTYFLAHAAGWTAEDFAQRLPLLQAHELVESVRHTRPGSEHLYIVLRLPAAVVRKARDLLEQNPKVRISKPSAYRQPAFSIQRTA